jgi:hypothetical protein
LSPQAHAQIVTKTTCRMAESTYSLYCLNNVQALVSGSGEIVMRSSGIKNRA